jgi:hypothetical protein
MRRQTFLQRTIVDLVMRFDNDSRNLLDEVMHLRRAECGITSRGIAAARGPFLVGTQANA